MTKNTITVTETEEPLHNRLKNDFGACRDCTEIATKPLSSLRLAVILVFHECNLHHSDIMQCTAFTHLQRFVQPLLHLQLTSSGQDCVTSGIVVQSGCHLSTSSSLIQPHCAGEGNSCWACKDLYQT